MNLKDKEKTITKEITSALARLSDTSPEDWYLVSRSRHALELVFRSVNEINPNSEVITQPFTCVTAINPILTSGLKPVYCDINKASLSIDSNKLPFMISPLTSAVIAQHTLGLTCDIEGICKLKKSEDFVLVEDSAHCLGRVNKKADVSIHSFGAEKILNTSFGAAIWINPRFINTEYGKILIGHITSLERMKYYEKITYYIYPLLNKIINKSPAITREKIRVFLSNIHVLIKPVMPIELKGKNFRKPKLLSLLLLKKVKNEIKKIEENLTKRNTTISIYNSFFKNTELEANSGAVRYPLLASNYEEADTIFKLLRKQGYSIGKWYRPLIFPGIKDKVYNYTVGSCPVAEECSDLIINLPTNVKEEIAKEIIDEIKNIRTK